MSLFQQAKEVFFGKKDPFEHYGSYGGNLKNYNHYMQNYENLSKLAHYANSEEEKMTYLENSLESLYLATSTANSLQYGINLIERDKQASDDAIQQKRIDQKTKFNNAYEKFSKTTDQVIKYYEETIDRILTIDPNAVDDDDIEQLKKNICTMQYEKDILSNMLELKDKTPQTKPEVVSP